MGLPTLASMCIPLGTTGICPGFLESWLLVKVSVSPGSKLSIGSSIFPILYFAPGMSIIIPIGTFNF